MKKVWQKIRHWFWWNFQATDDEKIYWQQLVFGRGISKLDKNGKRKFIDIRKMLF